MSCGARVERHTTVLRRFLPSVFAAVVVLSPAGCASTDEPNAMAGGGGTSTGATAGSSGGVANSAGNAGGASGVVATTGSGGSDSNVDASGTWDSSTTGGVGGAGGVGPNDGGPLPATAYVYISGYGPMITILTLDMTTGKLSPKGSSPSGGGSTSYLTFSPDNQFLYAVNQADGNDSKVIAFKINHVDGALTSINSGPTGANGSPHLSVLAGGKIVLVAHYNNGEVSTLKVDANGGIVTPPADVQHTGAPASHQIISDPGGKFVFVPNVSANTIFQFSVDAASGKLTANGQVLGFPGGAGPRHMALHPTGKFAYAINEGAVTVTSLTYDPSTGRLTTLQTVDSLPAGANRMGASGAHIIVHPSGKFVFSSNRGHDSISVFAVDPSGRLAQTSNETGDGLIKTPRDFGMDPSGRFLVVANQGSATALVFEISPADGKLTKRDSVAVPAECTFAGVVFLP